MESEGMKAEFTMDTAPKGSPTPGTHTRTVTVPDGEIELPEGGILKPNGKIERTKLTAEELSKAYQMKVDGSSWTEICEQMDYTSIWMKVRKWALANDRPYPPKAIDPATPKVADATPEVAPEPEPVEEVKENLGYELLSLADHPEIERTTPFQTHLLRFFAGSSQVRMGLSEPSGVTARDVEKIIARHNRVK